MFIRRFGRVLDSLPARFGSKSAIEELRQRQAETLVANARLLIETVVRKELEVDAAISRAPAWSDRWWHLVGQAGDLRTRRVELERQVGNQGQAR